MPRGGSYDDEGNVVFERRVTRDELIAEGSLFPGDDDDDEYEYYYEDDEEFIEDYDEPYGPYGPYEPYELAIDESVDGAYLPAYTSYAAAPRQRFRTELPPLGSSDGSEVAIPVAATTVYVPASSRAEGMPLFSPGYASVA